MYMYVHVHVLFKSDQFANPVNCISPKMACLWEHAIDWISKLITFPIVTCVCVCVCVFLRYWEVD